MREYFDSPIDSVSSASKKFGAAIFGEDCKVANGDAGEASGVP